jgi:hypothetical protein
MISEKKKSCSLTFNEREFAMLYEQFKFLWLFSIFLKELHLERAELVIHHLLAIREAFPGLKLLSFGTVEQPFTRSTKQMLKDAVSDLAVLYLKNFYPVRGDANTAELLLANAGIRGLKIVLADQCISSADAIAKMSDLQYLCVSFRLWYSNSFSNELSLIFGRGCRSFSSLERLVIHGFPVDRQSLWNIDQNAPNLRLVSLPKSVFWVLNILST